jgi:hypothetical protein
MNSVQSKVWIPLVATSLLMGCQNSPNTQNSISDAPTVSSSILVEFTEEEITAQIKSRSEELISNFESSPVLAKYKNIVLDDAGLIRTNQLPQLEVYRLNSLMNSSQAYIDSYVQKTSKSINVQVAGAEKTKFIERRKLLARRNLGDRYSVLVKIPNVGYVAEVRTTVLQFKGTSNSSLSLELYDTPVAYPVWAKSAAQLKTERFFWMVGSASTPLTQEGMLFIEHATGRKFIKNTLNLQANGLSDYMLNGKPISLSEGK